MNLRERISEIIKNVTGSDAELFVPDHEEFGHYFTNAGMKAAKQAGRPAHEFSKELAEKIKEADKEKILDAVLVAGPGFINFKISAEALFSELKRLLKEKDAFGKNSVSHPEKIQIEFISANPTGPLTLGNGRGVSGDVLGNILSFCGHRILKEYYVNDSGVQIKSLGHSVLGDALGEYKGEYIEELRKKIKAKDAERAGVKAASLLLKEIKKTVEDMGIRMDSWFFESSLHKKQKTEKLIGWLRNKDLAYENEGALWFRSSLFGDDKDRVLIKSDGEFTYFANDFAYHQNKFNERKFDRVIDIWGADHHGDVARVMAAAEVLGHKGKLEIMLQQFVRLMRDGREIRMSKRKGVYYTVDELLEEVGRDAFRFFFLMSSLDSHIDFNLELAKEQSLNNPVYYLKYAATRCRSLLKKAGKPNFGTDLSALSSDADKTLIFELIKFPSIVSEAGENRTPQLLARYALDLAKKFNNFYEKERIVGVAKAESEARLALVFGTFQIFKSLFDLFGIELPEKM